MLGKKKQHMQLSLMLRLSRHYQAELINSSHFMRHICPKYEQIQLDGKAAHNPSLSYH